MSRILSETVDTICLATRIVLECGGETYRAEDTVEKMAAGLGISHVEVLALPTGVMLTATDSSGDEESRIIRVRNRSIDLTRLDECNAVSRRVALGELDAKAAHTELERIINSPSATLFKSVLGWAFSSAAFAVMLGGGAWECLGAVMIGALLQCGMPLLTNHGIPNLVAGLATGFFATLFALLLRLAVPGLNIEPLISGTIMPMLPGLATTNAIRDTIKGDLVSGGARITEAVLTAAMIAVGICIMLAMWRVA